MSDNDLKLGIYLNSEHPDLACPGFFGNNFISLQLFDLNRN